MLCVETPTLSHAANYGADSRRVLLLSQVQELFAVDLEGLDSFQSFLCG